MPLENLIQNDLDFIDGVNIGIKRSFKIFLAFHLKTVDKYTTLLGFTQNLL